MKISQALDALNTGASTAPELKGEKVKQGAHKPLAEASSGAAPAAGSGSLNISQLSSKLQSLESRLANGDAFDGTRVSEIRQAIRDGSFKVNAEAVADRLLASAYDLFLKRH